MLPINNFISAVTLRREDVSLSSLISVPNFYTIELTRSVLNTTFKIQNFNLKNVELMKPLCKDFDID